MIIEDTEYLKKWLANTLKPICEADPMALAKYVVALVKKDKSTPELREVCLDQLDVFLQDKTAAFVEKLFDALATQSYMTEVADVKAEHQDAPATSEEAAVDNGEALTVDVPAEELPAYEEMTKEENGNSGATAAESSNKDDGRSRPSRSDHHSKTRSSRSGRRGSPRSGRTRSRSRERDRERDRDRPITERLGDRRRRSPSPPSKRTRRERSRSPGRGRSPSSRLPPRPNRYRRQLSPAQQAADEIARRAARTASLSPSPPADRPSRPAAKTRSRSRSRSPLRAAGRTETSQAASGEAGSREPTPPATSEAAPAAKAPASTATEKPAGKQRCRDYDEKGFCMRGSLCPFDHGDDPLVIESTIPPPSGTGPPMLFPPPPYMPLPFQPGAKGVSPIVLPPPLGLGNRTVILPPQMQQQQQQQQEQLAQTADSSTEQQQETMGAGFQPRRGRGGRGGRSRGRFGRGGFRGSFGRFGRPPAGGAASSAENCSLEVHKIPVVLNNIMKLNEHFSKFGTILNIEVRYRGQIDVALITYSSHGEAMAAHRSPEAILGNRFIRVYWHNKEDRESTGGDGGDKEAATSQAQAKPSPTKPVIPHRSEMTYTSPAVLAANKAASEAAAAEEADKKTADADATTPEKNTDQESSTAEKEGDGSKGGSNVALSPEARRKINKPVSFLSSGEAKSAGPTSAVASAVSQQLALHKETQSALSKYISQQKTLFARLEKPDLPAEDRMETMKMIKQLNETITRTKEILANTSQLLSKAQQQLPLQRAGAGRGRGRGGRFRGAMGRAGRGSIHKVDRRPSAVEVSGFDWSKLAELRTALAQFGTISGTKETPDDGVFVVTYRLPAYAENLIRNGFVFDEKKLQIQWSKERIEPATPTTPSSTAAGPLKTTTDETTKSDGAEQTTSVDESIDPAFLGLLDDEADEETKLEHILNSPPLGF